MTGLECLYEELGKRGARGYKQSTLIAMVLDIVADSGTFYTDRAKRDRVAATKLTEMEHSLRSAKCRYDSMKWDMKMVLKQFDEMRAYIEAFNRSLSECETPDGRDRMKRAQAFINAVNIDSKYDNTAFIIGLASILGEGSAPMDDLKKINPKLFEKCGAYKFHERENVWASKVGNTCLWDGEEVPVS